MHKKLVRFIDWHFAEVDPVRLKRTASVLREQILAKIPSAPDPYKIRTRTLPVVESAIRGEILDSIEDERLFISGNYLHDESEGLLPQEFDRDFKRAVAEFSATIQGLALDVTEEVTRDGVTYGWVEFEDEGDWPHNVKFP